MDVIYFIGDQRFLSLVTKSSDSSPFTCNGKILNLSDCQTLAEIIATTTSLLNPITTGNGQDNEIANNSCTPKAIILFSFLNDLSKRAADPTVSSKKGLWKAIKNVNPEKLAQEAADASNQWQAMIPGLRVIWVIPPKVDFQLTNESFVVEEKQDGLSERELRGCNESTKIFCQNIVELTAIFKSDHPCIEILDLAEILPKDFNVLPWKTELDYETKLSIFQEHLKLGANDSEVGNVSGIEIDDKAALYEPFSLSSAPLGIDSDVYPMTTESLPNLASVFNDEVIESTLSNATKEISVVEGSLFEHNVIDHVETVMNNQAVGAAMFEAEKLDESVAAGAALNYATITFGKDAVNDGFTDSEGNEASDNVPDDEVKHEATSNDDSDHLEQNLEDTDKDAENLLTDSQTTQNIYSENMKDSSIKASDNDEVTATHSLDAADIPASDAKTSLPDKGADANADLEVSATQLLDAAVIQAADDGVTSVLDEGALANADVEVNYTHLLGAADIPAGNDCITSVLDKGADACAEVEMSDTCLFNAADSPASNDVITSVLDKGTDANADVEVSETCLLDAAGDPTGNDCVTSVLDEGADPNAEVEVNDTRLLDAADIPAGNDCITFVLDKGALANAEVEVSDTDLLDAAVVPACDDGVTSVIYEGALANADVEVNDTDLLGAADIPAGNDCITSVLDEGALANAEVEVSDTDLLDAAVVPACDDSVTSVLYEGADAYSDVEVSATHLLDAADIPAGDDIVTSPDKDADDMTVSTDVVVSETNKLTPVNSFESEVSIMEINVPAAKKVYQESDILTDPEEMPETDAFANEGGVGAETDAFSGSVKMGVNADTTKNLTAAEVAHVFVNNNNENKLLDAVKETYKSEKLLPEICIAVSGENAEDQNDEKCVDAYNFIALNYESDGDKDYLVSNTSAGKLSGNFEGRDEEAPFETKDLPNQEPAFSSVEVVSVGVDAENIVHACKETEKDPLTCEFDATNESNDAVIIDESKTLIDDQEDAALHSTVMTAQNEIVVLHADTNLEAFEEGRAHESNHNLEEDMQGLSENDFNITDSEPEDELKMEEPIIDAAVISSDMDGNIINVQLDASVGYGRQRKSSELGTKPSGLVDYDDAEDETPEETEADLQAELDEIPILEAEENELNLVISDVMSLHDESQLECSVNQMQTTEEINSTQVSETKNVNELSALLKANEIGNSSGVVDLTESSRDSSYKDNIEETSAIWEIGVEPEELIYEDGFASDEGDADFSKEADDQKNELPKTSYEGENSADSSFDVVCLSSKEFPSAISPTKKKGHDVAKYFSEPAQAQKIIDSESTHHCGLQYIMEVIREPKGAAATADKSESKTETSSAVTTEDCFYICTQCSKILGNTTLLMRHIKSLPHKIKFAKLHFPDAVTDFAVPNLNWEPALLAAFKKVFSEKCQELDVYSSRLAVCKEEEYQRAAYFLQRHLGDLSAFPGCVRYASTPPISECVASPPPYYPTSEPLIQDQNPEVEKDAANAILAMTPKVDAAVASKSDAATTSAVDSGVSVLKDPRQKASVHLSGEEETHKRGRDEEDNDTSNNTKRSRNWLPSVTRSPRIYPPLAMDKHFSPTNSLPVKSRIGLPRRSTNDDLRYKLEKDHLNVHLPNRTSPTRQTRGIRSKTRSRSRSKSSDRYKRLNSSYRSYRNTFMWNKSRSRSASPRLRRKIYNRSRSRSPRRDRSRSPRRDRSRSPRRDRSRSPRRDRSRSLRRDRSRSPHRGRPRSPHRGRSRSPQRGRSRSPQRGRSRSSNRGRSKSPRRRSRTLSRSRSGSPRGHSLSSHKSSKGSRKHLSNTQPIGVQSKECGARRNPRNVSAVPEEENTAFDYAGSRARMLLGRTLAKTPVMGNETQPQGAATSATPHLPGHRLVASSGGTTTTKKQSFMPSTSQRLPVAHGPPPMVPLSDAHKRSRSNIPDSSQVDMISTLKNLGEMRELSEVKSCITTLLVAAVNCKMIKKDVMSTFRTPKNIVAAKRIYDKLFSCIPRSKFVPESKLVESFRSISRLITEIKTDIFCGVDAFEIASDSIELSESSIERVVNACLEGAECPEKMIPNVRKLIMDVIKLLHAQEAARLDSLSPQSTSKSKNANPEEIQQSGYNHIVSQKAREIDRAMKIKRELMPENVRIFRDDFARSTSLVRGPQQQPLDSSSDTASSSSAPSVRPMQTARTETLEYASSELLRKMEDEKLRRELQMHHDRALQERLRVMQQNMKDGGDWIVSSQRHDVSKHAPGALKATNKTAERERTKDLMDESLLLPLRFAGSKQSTSTKSSLSEMLEHEMRKYK
ncbi:uncharacterized protein LOC108679482 isoform X2 [Hyalella azteca]|uniref:Uncharacterized protein LOC108679482 isoform X2 n=1 Tax=Hyalella azteca TaxID=294128 RepID=A0A8B7PC66_HYAAZ|nr:uncharacterized protein LOC108679482 isoform X2 [Hyalella azteca]